MRVVLRVLTLPLAIGVAVFRSRALALLACLWLVAACSTTSATPSPSTAAESVALPRSWADCRGSELRTSAGTLVDLTGTWSSGAALRYVRQEGSCVWWFALSNFPNQGPGACFSEVFAGRLTSDFTLSGEVAPIVSGGENARGPERRQYLTLTSRPEWWTATRRWSSAARCATPWN